MTNILEKIIQEKKEALAEVKKNNTLSSLEDKIKTTNTFLNCFNIVYITLNLGRGTNNLILSST